MLKLKRVDIQGFKSFYDRTDMKFHGSGIAAIVGPNGCGKSNISDAISWVLGEQSAKSLRGTRMEDVIFAGTRERKPLGMAQVTLTMADPNGHLRLEAEHHHVHIHENGVTNGTNGNGANGNGANGNGISGNGAKGNGNGAHTHSQTAPITEVTITRRLYRSGDSDYLINGKPARLRDIQDLFSGTGLGPESYAIIEQGRIGQILSNKPADRRAVIEEAAGIGKYKTKKRLAEAKLESSRQNLSRVFDILEEVGRQVNSLKRQAAKAKRYEEMRTELVDHLKRAIAGRYRLLEREAGALTLDLGQAQTAYTEIAAKLQEQEREHTAVQETCYQTEASLTTARAQVAELNLEAERTRGRLEMQAKQIAGIDERLAAGETETQELDRRREQEQGELAAHAERLAQLEAEIGARRQALEAKTAERDLLQNDLRTRERVIEETRSKVLRLVGETSNLRNQVVKIEEYLAAIERDTVRIRREEEGAVSDITRLEQVKEELSGRLVAQQMELESLADRKGRIEADLASRRTDIQTTRHQFDEIRSHLSRQKARRDSLEEILSHRAYTTESVKQFFTAVEHGYAAGLKPEGVLADFVEVSDPNWEKACETFLHEELEFVVVKDWKDAHSGIELMRAEADGRATFLVHESTSAVRGAEGPADSAVAGRLSDAVRLTNGFAQVPSGLLPRLASCFLVNDHADAERLAPQHPECYFLLPDGTSYQGSTVTGGRKNAGGPLALKRELRELNAHVETRQRDLDAMAAQLAALEQSAAALAEELEHVRAQQQKQEKDALALDHEQRKLAEEHARAGQRLSVARLDLQRLERETEQSQGRRESSQAQVAEREAHVQAEEAALEAARAELGDLQSRVQAIADEHSAVRAEIATLDERLRSERGEAQRREGQIRSLIQRRENLARELERLGEDRARLLSDNVDLDRRAAELVEGLAQAGAEVARLTTLETEGRASLAGLEESLRSLRIESQAAQEKRSALEVELVKKQSDLKHLDESSRKELTFAAPEIANSIEGELDEAAVAEAEERSAEMRGKIEALGPVNTQALEEFQEASQRYEFLNTQRQDLLDSIRDTEKAIQELDTESRRRFKEAFDSINEHFKHMFRTLFGGGQGEMRLTDESNLAESGIDIMASPPGKKLQNVALLSGGEKSLTAMSLLMAIFRYTPSPFCILDEVDAPLDESNIQRLTRLIKEMSNETQFIVITHAKRTMEAAQALYGVTMQEPGVSTLVSVKFDPMTQAQAPQQAQLAAV